MEQVCREKDTLEATLADLPEPGVEPLLEISEDEIEAWVSDLRALVERGTVGERRGLLRAWIKRVVAHGDELTVEYTFPLVNVNGGPVSGSGGGRPPHARVAVNNRRRRKSRTAAPEMKKGETAVRRFLPTVRNGSPI